MKKTFLINGVNGFIGTSLVSELTKINNFNFVLNSNNPPNKQIKSILNKNKNIKFIKSNIEDIESVYDCVMRSDHVIHLASKVGNSKCEQDVKKTFDTNVLGALNILKACSDSNKSITFLSLPNLEDHSLYALSKSSADRFAQMYLNFRSLDISIIRLFNCYGEQQDLKSGKLIINSIYKSLKNTDISINGDGSNKLNFIYIDDAIKCLTKSIINHKKGIYYIGSNHELSVKEIVSKIIEVTNSKSKILYTQKRVGEADSNLVFKNDFKRIEIEKYIDFRKSISLMIKNINYNG